MTYTSIFLLGFRGTGKSTIAKAIASQLNMKHIDMDDEIMRHTNKSMEDLTNHGTRWDTFRKEEHEIFQTLISQDGIVVGTGGGTMVNTFLDKKTGMPYGRMHVQALHAQKKALPILLTADDAIIEARIRQKEMNHQIVTRPILDEARAKELQKKLHADTQDPETQKRIYTEAIIEDLLITYKERKPLYKEITSNIVDTGNTSVSSVVKRIINMWES